MLPVRTKHIGKLAVVTEQGFMGSCYSNVAALIA